MWIEARDEIWNEINNSNSCFVAKSSKSSETGGLECKLKCHHHLFAIAAFSTKAIPNLIKTGKKNGQFEKYK